VEQEKEGVRIMESEGIPQLLAFLSLHVHSWDRDRRRRERQNFSTVDV
jgi:hypothetical protein